MLVYLSLSGQNMRNVLQPSAQTHGVSTQDPVTSSLICTYLSSDVLTIKQRYITRAKHLLDSYYLDREPMPSLAAF